MDRLACVNVAALPLQLLLRIHPDWASLPVAVVEADRPQARVLFLNAPARRAGVRIGQRYATALVLARDLRADVVSPAQIEHSVRTVANRLRRYSPHVEPASNTRGVFWLDAQGLKRLYPSLHTWADEIRADLRAVGMRSTVAVGFTRFGTHALALSHRTRVVCANADEERTWVECVPLSRLDLDPDVRDRLLVLGVNTVGDFLRLPGDGIRTRFGEATDALYQLAAGRRCAPLVPVPAEALHERSVDFDAPERNVDRLVFVIKRLLDGLVATLTREARAVVEIALHMKLDDRVTRVERVRPAAPTLDIAQLLTLVRLRLDALRFSAGIVTLRVKTDTCAATPVQCRLFTEQTRRDAEAANQAFARIRAEWGEQSVVRARICDAHLPSARFAWEPLAHMPTRSAPRVVAARPRVRRIYPQPLPLPSHFVHQATGDELHASGVPFSGDVSGVGDFTPDARVFGPYVVSGGWWGGGVEQGDVHRDYYFVHANSGELWWLYYDRRRRRLFLQGQVE